MQHIVACERDKGEVDDVGVHSHHQQQHRQLQQRVQSQKDGTCHHGNHPAQYKELKGQRGERDVMVHLMKQLS